MTSRELQNDLRRAQNELRSYVYNKFLSPPPPQVLVLNFELPPRPKTCSPGAKKKSKVLVLPRVIGISFKIASPKTLGCVLLKKNPKF